MTEKKSNTTSKTPRAKYGQCGACGAIILWAVNTTTGNRAPIDVEPNPRGNVLLSADKRSYSVVVRALDAAALAEDAADVAREDAALTWHTNHFQTCPDAQTYRKRGSTR